MFNKFHSKILRRSKTYRKIELNFFRKTFYGFLDTPLSSMYYTFCTVVKMY